MDIGKFVDEFVKQKDYASKQRYVNKHIITTYLSYAKKIEESEKIIEYSAQNNNEQFYLNTPLRYMLFVMSVIKNYTDLTFDTTNAIDQFDLLEKHGIVKIVINSIEEDYERFNTVLNMLFDDYMINNRSTTSFLEQKINTLLKAIEAIDASQINDELLVKEER